jgi:hypothetical protein
VKQAVEEKEKTIVLPCPWIPLSYKAHGEMENKMQ